MKKINCYVKFTFENVIDLVVITPIGLFLSCNSMWFFARNYPIIQGSLRKIRFAILYWQSSNTSRILSLESYYVIMYMLALSNFQKKLILNWAILAKTPSLFLIVDLGHSLWKFAIWIPLHTLGVHECNWGAARGYKERSCPQLHSWTPFIHH